MSQNIYNTDFVRNLFNRMSGSYTRMNYITSFGFSFIWRKQFVNNLNKVEGRVEIIDLLSGMGETWGAIKSKFPSSNLSAVDFSAGMQYQAFKNNEKNFAGQVDIKFQNILNNQLLANHYDVVVCAFGLKTFDKEQLKILASEVKRILKPDGQFSFIEVSKPKNNLLGLLYGFYLGRIIPFLGKILLGEPAEYKMLWKYTTRFGNSNIASQIFSGVGLIVENRSYFYGCATGFVGRKSISDK